MIWSLLALVVCQAAEERHVLDNGLTVVLRPIAHQDGVAVAIVYRAGVMNEAADRHGVSHLVEHLVFRGATASFKAGEAEKAQIAAGPFGQAFMDANAETMHELTYFYSVCASDKLDQALKIEAERMSSAVFSEELLAQERPRTLEEAANVSQSPVAVAFQRAMELTYARQRFRLPKVGDAKVLASATLAECRAFYEAWYRPNNAILVLYGRFDPKTAKERIDAHFGPIAKKELPKLDLPEEPDATGERAIQNGTPKQVVLTWLSAPADLRDKAAILLGVYRLIASKGKIHEVSDQVLLYDDPFLRGRSAVTLTAFLKADADVDAAVTEARAWMESLAKKEMTGEELEAARFALKSELEINETLMLGYLPRNDPKGYARTLAQLTINRARLEAGGADRIKSIVEAVGAINAADVRTIASRYLTSDRANVVMVK